MAKIKRCELRAVGPGAYYFHFPSQSEEATRFIMVSPGARTVALRDGDMIAGCRILREAGRGGMGIVYLAEHQTLGRRVAIKVLPPLSTGEQLSKQLARFWNEARAASRIEHPNVVTIHDAGESRGWPYIVMQFVEGKNLSELLERQGGPLPWWMAARLVRSAAKGLAAVHAKELLHRDVKPSNIMVSEDGRVLLMDFGLVRGEYDQDMTTDGVVVGTVAYMSPEQSRGEELDPRSDVFSLGATLYTLVTGNRPYPGSLRDVLLRLQRGEPPSFEPLASGLPPGLARVIQRAMEPRRERRFATALEFATALQQELRNAPQVADGGTASQSSQRLLERVPELELVALDSEGDIEGFWDDEHFRWWIAGGGVVAAILLLGLVVNLLAS